MRDVEAKRWTVTTSRHRRALVFALSGMLHNNGWTATIGVGLWSLHVAYRTAALTPTTPAAGGR